MQILILAGIAAGAAAALWLAGRRNKKTPEAETPKSTEQQLREAGTAERLAEMLDLLCEVMDHPQLGGPGFLTVQFPAFGCGRIEASAQFPNIQESLYRRVVRGELDRKALIAAGIPEDLLAQGAEFAAESGGMVSVCLEADGLTHALEPLLTDRKGRSEVLQILAGELEAQYPLMTVRVIGSDLLLTPQRQEKERQKPERL